MSGKWDWNSLRDEVVKHGVRNSLLMAPMPTASTAQILGNNECFEPFTANIYKRNTLSGEFVMVNKHLIQDLDSLSVRTCKPVSLQELQHLIPEEVRKELTVDRDFEKTYQRVQNYLNQDLVFKNGFS